MPCSGGSLRASRAWSATPMLKSADAASAAASPRVVTRPFSATAGGDEPPARLDRHGLRRDGRVTNREPEDGPRDKLGVVDHRGVPNAREVHDLGVRDRPHESLAVSLPREYEVLLREREEHGAMDLVQAPRAALPAQ